MSLLLLSFSNNRWYISLFWLNVLFVVRTYCELEGGLLPHFKVDHKAGKLKITATRDGADISYKNDNVDMVVKPNSKEQAKLIINSMKDNEIPGIGSALVREESGQLRSKPSSSTPLQSSLQSQPSSSPQQLHIDASDDIGLRRSRINKHFEDDTDAGDVKSGDGVTWRGRINHASDEQPPDSKHVLSALSEIKNLMTLSMKPPNLKAFDAALPLSTDKYIHTASNVIKKLERAQEKKRRTEDTQENGYIPKVKAMIHDNLRNNTYNDDPTDFAYVQKAHEIIAQEHQHHKECVGAHCRHHILQDHMHKSCTGPHCRHDMYMAKEDPNADAAFEDEYIGKLKDEPNNYHNRDTDYESDGADFAMTHRKSHRHRPFDSAEYHSTHISPYHSEGDDEGYPATVYGDEVHHNSLDADDMHGSHNRHIHDNGDKVFEKEFENKINQKEYGDEPEFGGHHLHHVRQHHGGEPPFQDNDYLADAQETHDYDHDNVGSFHPHGAGGADEYDLSPYHHGGELTDLPEHHHLGAAHHDFHEDDGETEGHSREHGHPDANYDFDEAKEIKDEGHDNPDMMNGKLKDWYKLNAMGITPSNKLDEPMEGDIVVAANEKINKEKGGTRVAAANNSKVDEKKIESKFEQAGEKPLNSSEAELAINKLNESLANGLNESTIKAISSFDNGTDLADSNKTAADALNSFNNIKLESLTNDSLNVQKTLKDEEIDSHNATATHFSKTPDLTTDILNVMNSTDDVKTDNQSAHQNDLKKKISNIEKKINSSGDLMKKLEDLEKKMNTSDKNPKKHNQTTNVANTKKQQLSNTEKELLRVSPEDVLQTHMADEEFGVLRNQLNGTQRALNSSSSSGIAESAEKNETTNSTSTELLNEISNVNDTGSGASIENVYASIGEPGELSGEAAKHNASSENKTTTPETGTASFVEDKHAEQKNSNETDFENYWQKLHKTKVNENDGEKFGLLKRHKTKGYHKRRGSSDLKRHKTKEHSGSKRHKTKGRY